MLSNNNEPTKIALVTGGNQGLGKYLVSNLLEKNIKVISTSRSFKFSPTINLKNKQLFEQYLDVTSEESVTELFHWITSNKMHLSILVNNAGIGLFKPFIEITLD